ncbi:MAG TPA: AMP-binding protein, partial [Candidatus Limnocylindrales bacterium]|nr:AMP-binding protein [Candidatus Limnocylindrales bacterium]
MPAWSPNASYLNRSRLKAFAEAHGHMDYASLLRWSQQDTDGFWRAVDRDLDLVWTKKYERVFDDGKGVPWTTWWTGGRMNYVATALRSRLGPDRVAVIAEGEEGTVRRVSYGQLSRDVAVFAAGLRAIGVAKGDRVAVFMPMTYECVVAVLAVGALGAVFIPVFSGYAADAIAGRLRDCDAGVIITSDGFYRRGQIVTMKQTADAAADAAPSVRHVVVADRIGSAYQPRDRDIPWKDVVARGATPIAPVDTSA